MAHVPVVHRSTDIFLIAVIISLLFGIKNCCQFQKHGLRFIPWQIGIYWWSAVGIILYHW